MRGRTITGKLGKWHQVGLKFTDFPGRGPRLVRGILGVFSQQRPGSSNLEIFTPI